MQEITLAGWIEQYIEFYKKNEVKETTYWNYLELYKKHVKESEVGKTGLSGLTGNQLQLFYNGKKSEGYNPKTIRHMYILINSALDKAIQLKMLNENVNRLVVLPKKEAFQAKVLSAEEVRKIFSEAKGDEYYPIIAVTLGSGLRKGELMALKWGNIDFENKELHVEGSLCRVVKEITASGKKVYEYKIMEPKTVKSRRIVPLAPVVVEALEIQKKRQAEDKKKYAYIYNDCDLVFAKADGTYINQRGFEDKYHEFLKRYGISDVRFHDLRHTFASVLLEAGESPKIIQELLGHSTINTTMDIYAHTTKKGKINALQKIDLLAK